MPTKTLITTKQVQQDIESNLESFIQFLSQKIDAGFSTGEMSIGDIKFSSNSTPQPGWMGFGNAPVPISSYPLAWDIIGRKFELANRLAGNIASPDFHFYITPPENNIFIRSTIPSITVEPNMASGGVITIAGGHKIKRNGTPFYVDSAVNLETGTLSSFTVYFARSINATEFSIHNTEHDAINNVNSLTSIVSSCVLNFVGSYQLSALHSHSHLTDTSDSDNTGAGVDLSVSTSASTQPDTEDESQRKIGPPIRTSTAFGTPVVSNENRVINISLFGFIKVTQTIQANNEINSTKFFTNWEAVADFSATTLQFFHALNANMTDLIIKVMISPSGEEGNAFEASNFSIFAIDNDNIEIRFGADGASYVDNSGNVINVSNQGWSIKLVIYRPEVIRRTSNSNFIVVNVPNSADVLFKVPRAVLWNTPLFVIKRGVGNGGVVLEFFGDENETGEETLRIDNENDYANLYPYLKEDGERVWRRLNAHYDIFSGGISVSDRPEKSVQDYIVSLRESLRAEINNNRDTGIIVPMYIYPADVFTNVEYNALINLAKTYRNVPVIAVINPADGPGAVVDGNYSFAIKRMKGANIKVAGYISTDFGLRDKNLILQDIEDWETLYPEIDGIFFDEQPFGDYSTHSQYYTDIGQKAHDHFSFVISNPGSPIAEDWYVNGFADIFITWEDGAYVSEAVAKGDFADGVASYNFKNRGILVHSQAIDLNELEMIRKYFGWVYITDDELPNPWDTLPTYFDDLFKNVGLRATSDSTVVRISGDQTIDGIKTFSSTIAGSVNGNAATVTNGVYTSGNQTIAGIKTFGHIRIPTAEPADAVQGTIWVNGTIVGGP